MKNAGPSTQNYATPWFIVRAAEHELGRPFAVDVAADATNTKAVKYFTEADNGLLQQWLSPAFVQPPYAIQSDFLKKAAEELQRGITICLLLKAAISERYWRPFTYELGTTDFFEGRIAHLAPAGGSVRGDGRFVPEGEPVSGSDFASAMVWLGPGYPARQVRYRDARTGLLISAPARAA